MADRACRVDHDSVAALPSGTVTLLFSDMEGSTQLLTRLGDRYVDALDAQRRILREVWADCDGVELGTEGDSFYVVFNAAADGVRAVAQAQRALASFEWPGDQPVRVRMGLHTGAPMPHDGAYVGIDVHRAARIASSAHGGQIVVSAATAALVSGALPDGVALRDLGDHRLKDLERPEHVFQLEVDGLDQAFPPLRSLGASSNLPARETAVLGREDDLEHLSGWIRDGATRLLTLAGPGGTGKTTLAIELARSLVDDFPGGVYFVPLASVVEPQAMWGAIADVLGLADERDDDDVMAFLASRRAIVVLDNLEQIAEAPKVVHRVVSDAERLVVVATSRRPLHLASEQEYPVGPLALPDVPTMAAAERSPAVGLFVRQAQRVRPSFELTADNAADVVAVCERLDGIPLAIELAASRSKLLSPHAILSRLGSALDIAGAGDDRPSRHQTLRDTIEWSYRLLPPEQQDLFRRLGVFVGGADLEAVAAVCLGDASPFDPLDVVAEIVDASLAEVIDSADGEPRIVMLETIRSFAAELLELSGDRVDVRDRHARHFVAEVATASERLRGAGHIRARTTLSIESDNIEAALEWLLVAGPSDDVERRALAWKTIRRVGPHWTSSGRLDQSVAWFRRAVESGEGVEDTDLAVCIAGLSNALRFHGIYDEVLAHAVRAAAMMRAVDARGDVSFPYVLRTLAIAEYQCGDSSAAPALYEEAADAARAFGHLSALHRVLSEYGSFEGYLGHLERCCELEQEALDLTVALGDLEGEASCRQNLACTLRMLGQTQEAAEMMREAAASLLVLSSAGELTSLGDDFGAILAETGSDRVAVRLLAASDALYEDLGMLRDQAQTDEIAPAYDKARARLTTAEWDEAYAQGRATPLDRALAEALRETADGRG